MTNDMLFIPLNKNSGKLHCFFQLNIKSVPVTSEQFSTSRIVMVEQLNICIVFALMKEIWNIVVHLNIAFQMRFINNFLSVSPSRINFIPIILDEISDINLPNNKRSDEI